MSNKHNNKLLMPSKKGAIFREDKELEPRNNAMRIIRELGNDQITKSLWGKLVRYNRRVEIESMMSRWKRIYGEDLKSRCAKREKNEMFLKTEKKIYLVKNETIGT